jgi:hypothetical protein
MWLHLSASHFSPSISVHQGMMWWFLSILVMKGILWGRLDRAFKWVLCSMLLSGLYGIRYIVSLLSMSTHLTSYQSLARRSLHLSNLSQFMTSLFRQQLKPRTNEELDSYSMFCLFCVWAYVCLPLVSYHLFAFVKSWRTWWLFLSIGRYDFVAWRILVGPINIETGTPKRNSETKHQNFQVGTRRKRNSKPQLQNRKSNLELR